MTSFQRRKLPARSVHILLPLVITFCMTFVVSGVSSVKNLGFSNPDLWHSWMQAWGLSWLIAFPVLLVIMPLARKFVFAFVETP